MDVLTALHAAAAVLLVIAGGAKLARPVPTAQLLSSLGVPAGRGVVLAIGAGEIALGLAALLVGGPGPSIAVGLVYLCFAVVVARAMRVGAPSCGCFGRVDAPPSIVHVVGNLAFAVVSFAAAAGDTPLEVMDAQPAAGLLFVLAVGVVAGLSLVAFTALPEALGARGATAAPQPFRIDEPGSTR